jgi:hypothetical protein
MFSLTAAVNGASVVAPPPLVSSPVNLVRSSRNPSDGNNNWTRGITYLPAANGVLDLISDCSTDSVNVPVTLDTPQVFWQPYVLSAEFVCSAIGFDSSSFDSKATGLLDAATPKMIEYELWHGLLAQAAGWDNLYFTGASHGPANYDATSIQQAVGICEQYLASMGYGGRGMIHIPPFLAPYLGLFCRREGNLLLTNMDTIVVPGNGYGDVGSDTPPALPPTAPIEIYASGITDVRIGEIVSIPDEFYQAIDRRTNTVTIRAERYALASWDGAALCRVDLTLP